MIIKYEVYYFNIVFIYSFNIVLLSSIKSMIQE